MTTLPSDLPTDDGRWEFLEDTYWYVPTPYLPAVVLINSNPPQVVNVVDQTVWHIQSVFNGNVIGEVATTVGQGWTFSTLVGSIAPSGSVSFSFTPDQANLGLTVGTGTLIEIDGEWFFEMQMTTGSGVASITHWAYMAETEPGDRAFENLPGYPDTGIATVFDDDPSNDGGSALPLDLVFGSDADDNLTGTGSTTGVLLFGEGGDDVLTGSSEDDGLVGGAGDDTVAGRAGADDLYGESGADRLKGGNGEDLLDGGGGRDLLFGGNGRDLVSGGAGNDALRGGDGRDFFIFSGDVSSDTIADFNRVDHDRIDLSLIDAKSLLAGNNSFSFVGEQAFTGAQGQLRYELANRQTIIQGDIDGDGDADLTITLVGQHHLMASDFFL